MTATMGNLLASCSDDQSVRLWDLDLGRPDHTPQPHFGALRSACSVRTGTGAVVAGAGEDGMVTLWDAATGADRPVLAAPRTLRPQATGAPEGPRSGLDQQAGTRRPTDPGTALERSTCLDRFDRFRCTVPAHGESGRLEGSFTRSLPRTGQVLFPRHRNCAAA
ncbi:WD40 repeat domain-containing protein [Streptomyces sp. NPDC001312]|uniref:WD40 repeat domain-containing protein n=1 Tax=Streptomyces sp. NPDC001312 TaxID=3364561 RepID=UPI0036BFDDA8